jgi:hypothetical protein
VRGAGVALASGVQYAIMTPRPGIVQARAHGDQRASVRCPVTPGSPAMPRGSQEPPFCHGRGAAVRIVHFQATVTD